MENKKKRPRIFNLHDIREIRKRNLYFAVETAGQPTAIRFTTPKYTQTRIRQIV